MTTLFNTVKAIQHEQLQPEGVARASDLKLLLHINPTETHLVEMTPTA